MSTALPSADSLGSRSALEWRQRLEKKPGDSIGRLMARSTARLSTEEQAAYHAPFSDTGFRAAVRALAAIAPDLGGNEGTGLWQRALQFWSEEWTGRSLMVVGAQDLRVSVTDMETLQALIPGCPAPWVLEQAGHFVPEDGELIAERAIAYFARG